MQDLRQATSAHRAASAGPPTGPRPLTTILVLLALIVLAVPVILVTLLVVIATATLLGIRGFVRAVGQRLGRHLPGRRDGRRNVRVIRNST